MVRWLPAVLLALMLVAEVKSVSADFEAEEQTLTQEIEKPGLKGSALASAYMARGSLRLMNKQTSGALADYDQAVAIAPKFAAAYLHRAIGRRETGDLGHAMEDLSQAISLGASDQAAAYYLRGDLRAKLKDYRAAIADYSEAIALDKAFGHAYVGRGTAELELGDVVAALADATHAIESKSVLYAFDDPFRLAPHNAILFPRLHLLPLDFDHPRAHAYLLRAKILLQKGDYERARPDFQYAVEHDFKNPEVWLYHGLEQFAIHRCWSGENALDNAAEILNVPTKTLVEAHRAFVAKTPCAEDILQ